MKLADVQGIADKSAMKASEPPVPVLTGLVVYPKVVFAVDAPPVWPAIINL